MSQAGAVLLTGTVATVGLDPGAGGRAGSVAAAAGVHDPAKVLLDLPLGLSVGGDCLADVAVLRAEPGVFGLVASDPTVSRMINRLAQDATAVLAAINAAHAARPARGPQSARFR